MRRSLGVAAAGLCAFLNLYSTQALLPSLADEFGVPAPQTAWTITATLLAVVLVAPFAGGVSDALGRKRLIVGAGLLAAVPIALAATSASLPALVAWRFAQGVMLPFVFTVTVAYIADECREADAIEVTGHYALGCIVGGFSGRMIAGIVTDHAGWRPAFLVIAALTALAAATVAATLPHERRFVPVRSWRGTLHGFAAQFANPRVAGTCAVGFAVLFSMTATFTYVNFLLAAPPFGLNPAQLGLVFSVFLTSLVATPVGTRLAVRYGRRRALICSGAVAVTGMALTLLPSFLAVLLGLTLMSIRVFIEQTLSISYAATAATASRSTAVGLYVTCYYAGGSLGGVAPAGIWHAAGWPGCVALVILVQAMAVTLGLVTWRPKRA